MASNHFDQASRYLAKLDPAGFLGWLLGVSPTRFVFRGWLDTRLIHFPGEPDHVCDTVAHLEDLSAGHVPWAVALEFQSEPDPLMFGRFLGYLAQLWLEHKPSPERGDRFQLGAALVNLTGRGQTSRDMTWSTAGLQTTLKVAENNIGEKDAAATLAGIAAKALPTVVLPLVPLMKGGGAAGVIEQWKQLAGAEPDERLRSDYAGLAKVFAEAVDRKELWKEALKEWNMRTSSVVEEWRAEALVENAADSVLVVLQTRFGSTPPEIAAFLRGLGDLATLKHLLAEAARAGTLAEFQQHLAARNGVR